jgi:hypothetical protein
MKIPILEYRYLTHLCIETSEGLDKMYALQYFARIRSVVNFLPQLREAAATQQLARVISVLGAGNEGEIMVDDLELKRHFSLKVCSAQAITMMSLALEHLAQQNPLIDFAHVYPGPVRGTNIMKGMGKPIEMLARIAMTAFAPFILSVQESGKRHQRIATVADFESTRASRRGVDGTKALLRFDPKGDLCGANPFLTRYLDEGMTAKIWSFTERVFRQAYED